MHPSPRQETNLRAGSWLLVATLLLSHTSLASTLAHRAAEAREDATASYTHRVTLQCPQEIVLRVLNHPVLMAELWRASGYTPVYQITALDSPTDIHLDDPTGIVGDAFLVSAEADRRVYLAEGELDHWAAPMLNRGSVVLEISWQARGNATRLEIAVYLKPESWLAGAVLRAFSPVVEKHMGTRVAANARDAATILEDIASRPAQVALRLEGQSRADFENLFLLGQ